MFEDPKPARLDSSAGLSGFNTHVAYGVGCHTVPNTEQCHVAYGVGCHTVPHTEQCHVAYGVGCLPVGGL